MGLFVYPRESKATFPPGELSAPVSKIVSLRNGQEISGLNLQLNEQQPSFSSTRRHKHLICLTEFDSLSLSLSVRLSLSSYLLISLSACLLVCLFVCLSPSLPPSLPLSPSLPPSRSLSFFLSVSSTPSTLCCLIAPAARVCGGKLSFIYLTETPVSAWSWQLIIATHLRAMTEPLQSLWYTLSAAPGSRGLLVGSFLSSCGGRRSNRTLPSLGPTNT